MISTSDFSKGQRFLHGEEPYVIVDVHAQSPSARGGSTLIKIKARNLLNGKLISESFKSGEMFGEPDLRYSSVQFLYWDGDNAVFMDQENFEQFNVARDAIGNQAKYLNEELKIKAMYFNDAPVNVEIPQHVACQISSAEPGTKGNTANSTVLTNAELTNGITVKVPLNVKDGDHVLIDTFNDTFYKRA
jgi:elongation factor P